MLSDHVSIPKKQQTNVEERKRERKRERKKKERKKIRK
jgi:hypothetical protein